MTTRLPDLAAALASGALTTDDFLHQVCLATAERLDCNRTSLWCFEGTGATRSLRCLAMHDEHPAPNLVGSTLTQSQLGAYFAALDGNGVFESANALEDPRVAALRDGYLRPLKICSLLDVAFTLDGAPFGVLCCEQVGAPRRWQADDVAAVRGIGAALSLALAGPAHGGSWQPTQPAPLDD